MVLYCCLQLWGDTCTWIAQWVPPGSRKMANLYIFFRLQKRKTRKSGRPFLSRTKSWKGITGHFFYFSNIDAEKKCI